MQAIKVQDGTFLVQGQPLAHRAVLADANKPGVYNNLCKRGQKWELYHTASGASQAKLITDERVKEAKRALLEWHKANCKDCVERAPGLWDLCAEAQELLAGS